MRHFPQIQSKTRNFSVMPQPLLVAKNKETEWRRLPVSLERALPRPIPR